MDAEDSVISEEYDKETGEVFVKVNEDNSKKNKTIIREEFY